jgi:6-phosphogluconolactonase
VKRLRLSVLALVTLAAAGTAERIAARAERLVYIGTYTKATNQNSTSQGIYAFKFDDASGALTPMGVAAETPSPSFLTASADGRFLFAVNELQTYEGAPGGSATSFAVDKATGKLTELSVQATKGSGPCHLVLDQTGRYLAVANYGGGSYSLFPVGADGKLQPATAVVAGDKTTVGDPPTQVKPLGHAVAFDATNRFLVTSDKGLDKLLVFRFDAAKGTLTPNDPAFGALPARTGPRHFGFHPSGQWVFSLGEQGINITTFAWNATTGALKPLSSVPTRPAEVTSGSTAELEVHPTGKFVYASNRGHDTIAAFSVGANGALTLVEYEPTRGKTPRSFAIDPTGRWLIAANQNTGDLSVFSLDQTTGALSPVGELSKAPVPVSVLFIR